MCIKNKITRKPKEIADIFDIPQTDLSFGEKIIDKLIADGQLESESTTQGYFDVDQEIESFTDRYFEDLDIPNNSEYKSFVMQLIKFTIDKHIADSSVTSSKCAGAIYILALKCDELKLKWNHIQTKCKISKSTFARFANAVLDASQATCGEIGTSEHLKFCSICRQRQQLKRIFKKNNVLLS